MLPAAALPRVWALDSPAPDGYGVSPEIKTAPGFPEAELMNDPRYPPGLEGERKLKYSTTSVIGATIPQDRVLSNYFYTANRVSRIPR